MIPYPTYKTFLKNWFKWFRTRSQKVHQLQQQENAQQLAFSHLCMDCMSSGSIFWRRAGYLMNVCFMGQDFSTLRTLVRGAQEPRKRFDNIKTQWKSSSLFCYVCQYWGRYIIIQRGSCQRSKILSNAGHIHQIRSSKAPKECYSSAKWSFSWSVTYLQLPFGSSICEF